MLYNKKCTIYQWKYAYSGWLPFFLPLSLITFLFSYQLKSKMSILNLQLSQLLKYVPMSHTTLYRKFRSAHTQDSNHTTVKETYGRNGKVLLFFIRWFLPIQLQTIRIVSLDHLGHFFSVYSIPAYFVKIIRTPR